VARERAKMVCMVSPRLRRLALALLAGTAVVGALGAYQVAADGPRVLSLDYERTIPAFWSGGVLWLAALAALLIARDDAMPGPRWPWWGLAALFAFMGVDEISSIHERVARLTGLRWEIPYIPIMLGAAVLGVAVLLRLYRERPALAIGFALGGATWAGSQVFEVIQWHDGEKVAAYNVLMVIEEIGEMTGSAIFALALFGWVWRAQPAGAPAAVRSGERARDPAPTR
jgi:hypothetical protein